MTNDKSMEALIELFPDMDKEVIETILYNNSGQMEATVNILLSMTDPEYKPDKIDTETLENIQKDAIIARNIADAEFIQHSSKPIMHKSTPVFNTWSTTPQQQKKKPSKFRDIFRRNRHSDVSTSAQPNVSNVRQDITVGNPDRYIRPSHTLESDFSDTESSANSNTSNNHSQPLQQRNGKAIVENTDEDNKPLAFVQPLQQQNKQPHTLPTNDLFGLYEDPISSNSLASYEPLSPSKCMHAKPAEVSAPFSPTKQQTPPPPFATVVTEHPQVDLNNPFDDNPLLHTTPSNTENNISSGNTTNPFTTNSTSSEQTNQLPVDTNPFRNRLNI
ncbi:hypothetical protein COEREDRAFT_94954 [Coemansia reversa NRRL 1564]|uniref:CUE domain-containing protein n=1 Tax=Coemansia reversa (strain ATCC 12441 / NRRL 1564) TaxID=763665 RepID=A0A2G5B128_COERN|nr:hypothetical protein COEREDRAFT_94954 [Coemansia reversa NRRL 1564]|eukprot:PIA12709.1 hypothetical protein COEREDRAFT_94954 [Coemansia reversa NRRL 1564]